jgi:hypothetical protein
MSLSYRSQDAQGTLDAFVDEARKLGFEVSHVYRGRGEATWRFRVQRLQLEPAAPPIQHLYAKRYSNVWPKTLRIKSQDYGERRLERERNRAPLLADLPGWTRTPEEYQAEQQAKNDAFSNHMRAHIAQSWRRVRSWLSQADEQALENFWRHWDYLPHAPEYALDLITSIESRQLRSLPARARRAEPTISTPCEHGVIRTQSTCRRCNLDERRQPARELESDHRAYNQAKLF